MLDANKAWVLGVCVVDLEIHHRRSIRLRGFDYSQDGAYFVTLCAKEMRYRFGVAVGGRIALNDAGRMVERWCAEIAHKFPGVSVDESVVMPNHFHAIFVFRDADVPLGTVVQWFKTMSTNEYIRGVKTLGWTPFDGTLWQRDYYERIVRADDALENIRRYIRENPANFVMFADLPEPRVWGDAAILQLPRIGYLASRENIGRGGGGHAGPPLQSPFTPPPPNHAIISGFLSPLERRVFREGVARGWPLIWVKPWGHGRGGPTCPPSAGPPPRWRNVVVVSPFDDAITAPSARRAAWCNEYVMRNCAELRLGYVRPGGMLECLLSDAPPGLAIAY